MEDTDHKSMYAPVFLTKDELGDPQTPARSLDVPVSEQQLKPTPDSFLTYDAAVDSLRIMSPHKHELQNKLGPNCHVVQFKTPYSLNSVPNEFKTKESPLLWKVKAPGAVGFTTDQDLGTFYFPDAEQARCFFDLMLKGEPGPSFDEAVEQKKNLRNILW